MKPTPEQIAAAKAWTRSTPDSPITAEQHAALVAYAEANKGTPGLWIWSDAPAFILLAALEAAEAKVDAMASRESASVAKEIETSADMLAQVQNAEARVKELEERLKGTLQAGGYQYFCEQLHAAEREACNARYVAEQLKKKLEASEVDGARLDWLFDPDNSNTSASYFTETEHECGWRNLFTREELDAARKAQP